MVDNVFDNLTKILLGVFSLAVLVIGVKLASKAQKAQYSETARTGFNMFVAIVIVSIGLGGLGFAVFGKSVLAALGIS